MTKIDDIISRVSQLEETVTHLATHHDEQFVMVHDETVADTCDRLFNVNLQRAQRVTTPQPSKSRAPTRRAKRQR
ncbi:MAG: hypothetical protein JO197_15565 [Acidobacteria bacterium]|nr:hypothetical protein [Acidobacteriota bacterium]MBV9475059.1 hypothetical protein [Acidobacteriota bacterium]